MGYELKHIEVSMLCLQAPATQVVFLFASVNYASWWKHNFYGETENNKAKKNLNNNFI